MSTEISPSQPVSTKVVLRCVNVSNASGRFYLKHLLFSFQDDNRVMPFCNHSLVILCYKSSVLHSLQVWHLHPSLKVSPPTKLFAGSKQLESKTERSNQFSCLKTFGSKESDDEQEIRCMINPKPRSSPV